VLAFLLLLLALPALAANLSAGSATAGLGDVVSLDIILDSAENGLSGYNLTLSLSNPEIAEIVSVDFPDWASLKDSSKLPSDAAWIKAVDLNDNVKPGQKNVKLATLKIRCDSYGSSEIRITVNRLDDDSGNPIAAAISNGRITVGQVTPTPIPTPIPTPTPTPTPVQVYIEPNTTTVAPGEQFAVNVSVKDGTAQSVVAEFTFDASKVAYITRSTYGLFTVLSNVSGNIVRVLGFSDKPVDISSKTKLATVVFSVNQNATGTIVFNCLTANVDGRDVACVAGSLAIAIEVWQAYDKNGNGKIETAELIAAIQDWLNNKLSTVDLIKVIQKWLQS
jgi:hypothetical protein